MTENKDYYNNEDEEIDIGGLFFYVCRHWRSLILLLIIGAALGCLFSIVKMNQSKKQAAAGTTEIKLEPNRKAVVDEYGEYLQLLEKTSARTDDSVILNMDPSAVYTGSLSYFVSCKNDDIDRIGALAESIIYRDGNIERLHEASGIDCSLSAFEELITASFYKSGEETPGDIYIAMENDEINEDSNIAFGLTQGGCFNFSIKAPTENAAKAVLAEMDDIVNTALKKYSENYEGMSFVQLKNHIDFGYSKYVATVQRDFAKEKKEYTDVINSYGKDLTEEERAYYKNKFKAKPSGNSSAKKSGEDFSLKWPIIGAAALFFICAVWHAFKYLINDRIKNEEDLGALYGLKVLGSVRLTDEGKTGLDRLIDRLDSSRSVEPVNEEYLNSLIQGLDAKSIALVEATASDTEKETAARLAAGDSRLVDAGCMLNDNSFVSKLMGCDGIIIVAGLGMVRHQEMVRMLELAQKFGKPVLGVVVVR